MKTIKSIIFEGCAYTVVLTFVLYIILSIGGLGSSGIPFLKFLLVLGFGFLIPVAGLIRSFIKKPVLARLLHYAMLLSGFIVVYLFNISTSSQTSGNVFVAMVLFTVVYASAFGIKMATRRFWDKHTEGKKPKSTGKKAPEPYKSRFGE